MFLSDFVSTFFITLAFAPPAILSRFLDDFGSFMFVYEGESSEFLDSVDVK